jgi:hypothetical protein
VALRTKKCIGFPHRAQPLNGDSLVATDTASGSGFGSLRGGRLLLVPLLVYVRVRIILTPQHYLLDTGLRSLPGGRRADLSGVCLDSWKEIR